MLRGFEDDCGGVMALEEINFHAMGGNKMNFYETRFILNL